MHGQLLEVNVAEGDLVQKGQRLLILEAMKMRHEIVAGVSGKVLALKARAGDQLAANELIIEIEPCED
jgi:biotin carboxyl carrier protein